MQQAADPFRKSRRERGGPTDLRSVAFATRTYPPNPEAARRFREVLKQKPKTKTKPVKPHAMHLWPAKKEKRMETKSEEKRRYPLEAYRAAEEVLELPLKRRRYGKVFTPAVIAVWLDWLDAGKSVAWIAANNGLVVVSQATAAAWIEKHRTVAERLRSQNGAPPLPPKPPPKPEPPEPELAVAKPEAAVSSAARPVRGLSELLRLLDDGGVRVKGRVKVELDIEF